MYFRFRLDLNCNPIYALCESFNWEVLLQNSSDTNVKAMKRSEYIEFKWLAILLVAGILMTCPNLVASLPLDSFYPYDVGDNKTNVSDDESSQPIELYVGFPFFNKTYSRIYVNNNGIISFNDKISTFKPQNFNDSDFDIRLPLVAPFWADVDIEHPKGLNGTIVYRLVDDKRLDHEILNRASQDVKTYFKGNSKFSAKIVLIVTWYEVGFYGALMDGQLKRNTFQTVLISDGRHSYAIFNYKKISWTTGTSGGGDELTGLSTLDGKPAVVGLYSGWESYYIVPQSGTPAVFNITNTTNVDIPGRYMFRIDGPEVDDRSSMVSSQSEAVKCYVCTSLTGGGCADPFTADSTVKTQDSCAICGKTKGAQSGVQVVARTCETSSTGMSAGCQSASQGGASADLCYCTSDLCNASTRASITTALLFLLPALLLCFKKL